MSLSDSSRGKEPHQRPPAPPQTGQHSVRRTATDDSAPHATAPVPPAAATTSLASSPGSKSPVGDGGGGGPLVEVGFWADPRDERDPRPDPARLVDEEWGATAAARAVELYARSGFLESFELGYSFCRLGCSGGGGAEPGGGGGGGGGGSGGCSTGDVSGSFLRAAAAPGGGMPESSKFMGCATLTDGKYVWPEGLAHYVSAHAVRLPEDFVARSLGNLRALRGAQAGGRLRWDVDETGKGRTVPLEPGTAVFLRDKTTLGIALPPEPEMSKGRQPRGSERGPKRSCMIS